MRRISFISFIMLVFLVSNSWGADRLIVKDDAGTQKFTVTDQGRIGINTTTPQAEIDLGGGAITLKGDDSSGYVSPRLFWKEEGRIDFGYGGRGGGNLEAYAFGHASRPGEFRFVYGGGDYGNIMFKHFDGAGHWDDMMTLDKDGKLIMSGGAYCDGYTWVDASSREYKENIEDLTTTDALETLKQLKPVSFQYKTAKGETNLGFIAEDVPEMVSVKGRKGVKAMDFVAVLTKVAQEQQEQIANMQKEITLLKQQLLASE